MFISHFVIRLKITPQLDISLTTVPSASKYSHAFCPCLVLPRHFCLFFPLYLLQRLHVLGTLGPPGFRPGFPPRRHGIESGVSSKIVFPSRMYPSILCSPWARALKHLSMVSSRADARETQAFRTSSRIRTPSATSRHACAKSFRSEASFAAHPRASATNRHTFFRASSSRARALSTS